MSLMRRLARCRLAVSALEYGLITALIAVAIVASATTLGVNLGPAFIYIASKL